MKPHNLRRWNCEEAERIVIPEILLCGEWEILELINMPDVARFEAELMKLAPVEGNIIIEALHHGSQPFALQADEPFPVHTFDGFVPDHRLQIPLNKECSKLAFNKKPLLSQTREAITPANCTSLQETGGSAWSMYHGSQ
jgi:hypothetical protein